ncbi:tRNA 2-selenouridine(34) synthase MnmH [Rossellomorea vietnamensis]|uniref:tRNA 2-selenouridine synthase n=1 Tax=Rossellomorea vietnamensis TaxID=218284 RepID=A0A0P6VV81_9BACI|nr:tRNA 2-selenouridine(34) synthase MnmH [Rossellomorea vietnamensis]KPL58669.1 tRNA 2-selenouridine synthase [Rossellomorea vietnamensis]
MFKDLPIEQCDLEKYTFVDVRSPSEYREMTIPGSLNIPVFDDEERAEVGTLYKQVSKEVATDRGLEIFSGKLPRFINEFKKLEGEIVVFCWRGGMRSKAAATFLDLMGIRTSRILGGVRAYRHWVLKGLENIDMKPASFVLNGGTGTGKTAILKKLQEEGYPVLDIEGLANHRGSIFGEIGLTAHNQKTFDSLLLRELKKKQESPFLLFEAESKRIGKVLLPDFLIQKKEEAFHIFIEMPMKERVHHILEEYRLHEHHEEFVKAFRTIKRRIHSPIANEIEGELQERNYERILELLIEYYYDPRYLHMWNQYPEDRKTTVKVNSIEEAYQEIKKLLPKKSPLVSNH